MQELSRKAVLEQQEKNKIQMESILEDQRKKFQEFLQEQVVTREYILLDGQTALSTVLLSLKQGFWFFARSRSREIQVNLRNPAKFTKTRKIPRHSVEILSNTCLYNIFETYFSYRGYLLAVNLQIYLGTSSLKRANNVPKLPGVDYVAKNWALAMMLKALPLVHFVGVLLLKEKMMIWSAQNRPISSEICLENNHKIVRVLPIASWRSLPWNFPWNSREIGRFFREFVPKNPAEFDFFLRDLSEAL